MVLHMDDFATATHWFNLAKVLTGIWIADTWSVAEDQEAITDFNTLTSTAIDHGFDRVDDMHDLRHPGLGFHVTHRTEPLHRPHGNQSTA